MQFIQHAFITNLNRSILISLMVFASLPEFQKTCMVQNFCLHKICIKLHLFLQYFIRFLVFKFSYKQRIKNRYQINLKFIFTNLVVRVNKILATNSFVISFIYCFFNYTLNIIIMT